MGFTEPHTTDGVDYVMRPGKWEAPSVIGALVSFVRKQPPKPPTVHELLMQRTPLPEIGIRHGMGLDHLLRDGVTMDELLRNGYQWKDLKIYSDVSQKGQARALQTLGSNVQGIGFRTQAVHFRDYPHALPWEEVSKDTGLEPHHLGTAMGLAFRPAGPLQCTNENPWSAAECVAFGLTIDDLFDMGLDYIHQYEELMAPVPSSKRGAVEKQLGTTKEHIARLVDYDRQFEEEEEVVAPVVVQAPSKPVQEEILYDDTDEMPVIAAPQPKQPQRQPNYNHKYSPPITPTVIAHQPRAPRALRQEAAPVIRHVPQQDTATIRAALQKQDFRARDRALAQRHGVK